jgi:hydrogenase maturation protease
VDLGTAILHGLPFLEAADRVLVIDAAQGGRPPGTLYLFEATDPVETKAMFSIHAMGLREALRLLPPGVARPRITVLGVEPESLAYGMNLSPRVQAVLPSVVELARQTVEHWLAAATPPAICERELQPDKLDDCYAKLSQ